MQGPFALLLVPSFACGIIGVLLPESGSFRRRDHICPALYSSGAGGLAVACYLLTVWGILVGVVAPCVPG